MAALPVDVGTGIVRVKLRELALTSGATPLPELHRVNGRVTFTPTVSLTTHVSGLIINMSPVSVYLDSSGDADVELIATDDVNLSPSGWQYKVSFDLDDVLGVDPLYIWVAEGSDSNLSDIVTVYTPEAISPPSHKHVVGDITATGTPSASTYLRGDGSWSTPTSGDVGADPAGTAASLVGALTIPDSPDDIGAATAAQGAKADTAVQPADLAAHTHSVEEVLLSNTAWPQVAAHRMGAMEFGESNLWAGDQCIAAGVRVLETDFQFSSDGEAILMHDTTLDRTTTGTGNVVGKTAAQLSALRVDLPTQFRATGYADQIIPTLNETVARYRGRAILCVEQKAGTDADVPALAAQLRQAGGRDFIIIQSFNAAVAEAWAAQGFQSLLLSYTDIADHAALYASGVRWVGYSFDSTGTAGQIARIAAAKAAGLKVATWTHARRTHVQAALAAGSDMPMSDYPADAVHTTPRSFSFANNRWPIGSFDRGATGSTWSVANGMAMSSFSESEPALMVGDAGPLTAADFTASVTYRHVGTVSAGWGGILLGGPIDLGYKESDGYHTILRSSGIIDLFRVQGFVGPTKIGTLSTSPAIAADTDYTVSLRITPTHVIATRVDTGQSLSVADATYRHAQWWPVACRATSATEVGIRAVTVA